MTLIAVVMSLQLGGCFARLDSQQAQIESQILSQQQEIEQQALEIEQLKALAQDARSTGRRSRPHLRYIPATGLLWSTVGSRPIHQQQEGEQQRLEIEELTD